MIRKLGFGAAALLAAAAFITPASAAMTGAEVVKSLDGDADGTLDMAEIIKAGVKTFQAINPDGDTTLESGETKGRLTEADWKRANTDGDKTLEMDEWLKILRARVKKADPDKDGTLDAKELDTKAGQAVVVMITK